MSKKQIIDPKKICWSCHGPMSQDNNNYTCQKCGATYTDLPKPGAPAAERHEYIGADGDLRTHWTPKL
jgi:hypothetical protein